MVSKKRNIINNTETAEQLDHHSYLTVLLAYLQRSIYYGQAQYMYILCLQAPRGGEQ